MQNIYGIGVHNPEMFLYLAGNVALWMTGLFLMTFLFVFQHAIPVWMRRICGLVDSAISLVKCLSNIEKWRRQHGTARFIIRACRRIAAFTKRLLWRWCARPVGISVFLLGTILFSRLTISYFDPSQMILAPERIFYREHTARDFLTGVYRPSIQLLMGKFHYTPDGASYGSVNAVLFGVLLSRIGPIFGQCLLDSQECFRWLYALLVYISIVLYLFYVWLISRNGRGEIRWALYTMLFAFLLGVTGSFGIERGNPDILWSSLVGIMLYAVIQSREIRNRVYAGQLSLVVGALAGILVNAKIFLLPVAFVALFMVRRIKLALGIGICTFLLVTYLPQSYGAKTTMWDLFNVTSAWVAGAATDFDRVQHLTYNHSAQALATWFTSCVATRVCMSDKEDVRIESIISWVILLSVFILPFISKDGMRLGTRLFQKENLFLYVSLAVAAINLIPQSSFIYRLYYSLPVALLMLVYVQRYRKSSVFLILSISMLILKGMWMNIVLQSQGWALADVRIWNLLVPLHYYFLIRAGLAYAIESGREKRS